MTSPTTAVLDDLAAEHAGLDALVAPLSPDAWLTPTPAEGWSVLDTIGHLAFFDERVSVAAAEPDRFRAELAEVIADLEGFMNRAAVRARELGPAGTLEWWRAERQGALSALAAVPPGVRIPWYGPDMSVASAATARLMETWAHGQDVVDALGVERAPTARLRHVALLCHKAFANSFLSHGLPVPEDSVRVELTGPDGEVWEYGDPATPHVVRGSALDLCLLATQRRHRADLALEATPGVADQWLDLAQAFAGPGTHTDPTRAGLPVR